MPDSRDAKKAQREETIREGKNEFTKPRDAGRSLTGTY